MVYYFHYSIGFGDLTPGNRLPQWFVSFYTLMGLCTMSSLLHSLVDFPRLIPASISKTCTSCCVKQKSGDGTAGQSSRIL